MDDLTSSLITKECSILYREFFKIAHKEHNQVMLAVVIANLRVYFKVNIEIARTITTPMIPKKI